MPARVFPTGVTINKTAKAHPTYVLFDGRDATTRLIDMNGNVVRTWPYTGFPSEIIDPALNDGRRGHVLLGREPAVFENRAILELDWNGDEIWRWGDEQAPGGAAGQNHDLARLPNGNTIVISRAQCRVPKLADAPFVDQPIYEIDRQGNIQWSWLPHDHLAECGFSEEQTRLVFSPRMRGRISGILTLNNLAPLGPNRWHDSGDPRFHPDNLMIDSREGNFAAIIEKETGRIVWRIGPDLPGTYDFSRKQFSGPLPRPLDSLSGLHDAHVIPKGLPGAGNVLIFDNQGSAGFPPAYLLTFPGSRILEIDPEEKTIVWQYDASVSGDPLWTFYSSFISSARRLPNGNTLVCEGMNGRIFQVTRAGEVVWEFVNPYFGPYSHHLETRHGGEHNWVFRAQPVPREWVPEGTPFAHREITPPANTAFRIRAA